MNGRAVRLGLGFVTLALMLAALYMVFVDVPTVIVSVRLWRTIHPAVLVTRQGGHGLQDPRMVTTLLVSLAAFTALFIWILCLRFVTLRMHTRLGALARSLALAEAAAQD